YSWVWRDMPGTLTLSLGAFMEVVREIARSVHRWGVQSLLVISGHAANQQPLKYVVRELSDELPLRIVYLVYPNLDAIVAGELRSPRWGADVHACEIETSLLLAVRPDLCRMERAIAEYPDIPPAYQRSALSM